MSTNQENEDKIQVERKENSTRTQVEKLRSELRVANARVKAEEKARQKAEEALAKAKVEAQNYQDQAEHDRQIRLKAEQALNEAQKTPSIPPAITSGSGRESRLVFVLRLALDENRQPKRVEIEENQSRRKDSIPGLDPSRIMAFIKSFLPASDVSEERPAVPPAQIEVAEEIERMPTIVVVGVHLEKTHDQIQRWVFSPYDTIKAQVNYRVENLDLKPELIQGESFEINVHARNNTANTYQLLASFQQAALPGVAQYSAELELTNLSSGLYTLFSSVALPTARIGGFLEGPVFEVAHPPIKEPAWPESRREELTSPN